ncbi:MAG: hypothetical protein ABI434_16695 [Burkholderiaceae bacterium]
MQIIQSKPSWQLAASVQSTPHGHHLIISSFVPTARRPEHQVKFSGTFSDAELRQLVEAVAGALERPPIEV